MLNPLEKAKYLLAAHIPSQLPADIGYEVAFAGRSKEVEHAHMSRNSSRALRRTQAA